MKRGSARVTGEQLRGRDLDLLSRIPAIVCELEPDGRTLFVNQAVAEITGYRPEELVGKNWWDVFYPGSLRHQVDELYTQFEGGDVVDCEMVLAARDATLKTLIWYSSNRRLADGTLDTIVGFGLDATERRAEAAALRETTEMLRGLIRASPLAIFALDPEGNVKMWNPAAERIFGWAESEVLGGPLPFVPEDRRDESRAMRERLVHGELVSGLEVTCRNRDGSEKILSIYTASVHDAEGNVNGMMAVVDDVTERRRAEDLFKTVCSSSLIGIHIVQEGKFRFVNPYFERMTGCRREELIGRYSLDLVHPEDREKVRRDAISMLKGYRSTSYEYRVVSSTGEPRWVMESVTSIQYEGKRAALASCSDVTERKRLELELARLADHDHLTGLPNRRVLEGALTRVIARARRGALGALLYIDVDNFKEVNDSFGHAVGDCALVALAGLLQGQLRTEDLLARLGGDEFAVLLESAGIEQAIGVATRLCEAVRGCVFEAAELSFHLSLSVGLEAIDGTCPPEVVLSRADAAMYQAKAQGGNRVVQYAPKTDGATPETYGGWFHYWIPEGH